MARKPSLDFRKTPKGWLVNIPGSLSDTGRFRRRYFKTRDLAKAECRRLRETMDGQREKSADITSSMAEDATKAATMLKPFGITLSQCAKYYTDIHDKRGKAPTLSEAWDIALSHRENHRPRTIADMRAWKNALPDWLMAMNCYDLAGSDISKALDETTAGTTRWKSGLRYISAVLGDVVKSGAIEENPVKKIQVKRNPETLDDVRIYTPTELKKLFGACVDYPLGEIDRLCTGCLLPFAFQAFAGVRPEEITKLRWEDVSLELENIRIGAHVAKKQYRRNIRLNSTLAAWIRTVSPEDRKGKIAPARWRQKAAKARTKAGIDGREMQDALRHSYGSYQLATDGDLDALKQDMGHGHIGVFFEHYHKALTKAEALPYWQVLPAGVQISTIKSA